jgi:ubiquinone/menaquinone biosynthesis C-methylase UbiE
MDVKEAYKNWAQQYDTNDNKTRDLEAIALRETLGTIKFTTCLELGCGTGKNTEWLITKAEEITAVDLSEEMLLKAKEKINADKVTFLQADINKAWNFTIKQFDLVVFSLVLEHVESLDNIFKQASVSTLKDGYIYIGELHPYKQYAGSKARFKTEEGEHMVPCFNHNISDFTQPANKYGFSVACINEYFDNNDRSTIPRILTLLLKRTH